MWPRSRASASKTIFRRGEYRTVVNKTIVVAALSALALPLAPRTARASQPCLCPTDVLQGGDVTISKMARRMASLRMSRVMDVKFPVPLNLEWRTHEPPDPEVVFEPMDGGDPIGLTTEMGEAGIFIVRPERALSPNTVYRFAGVIVVTRAAADTTPPDLRDVEVRGIGYSGACPSAVSAAVTTSSTTDDTTSESMLVYRVEVIGEDSEKIIYLPTRVQAGSLSGVDELTPAFGACDGFCPNNFPDAKLDKDFTATVSAFDLAGNESVRYGPIPFRFAETKGGLFDCSATGTGASDGQLLWSLALVFLAIGSRRRRG